MVMFNDKNTFEDNEKKYENSSNVWNINDHKLSLINLCFNAM
jgi:hypothetical protein